MPVSTPALFAHVTPVPFLTPDWAVFVDVEVSCEWGEFAANSAGADKVAGA